MFQFCLPMQNDAGNFFSNKVTDEVKFCVKIAKSGLNQLMIISPLVEFLNVIGTKVQRVFLLVIHSHLY
jgi:hypothetical protein